MLVTDVRYDPNAPEVLEDPFPFYKHLRNHEPLHRTDQFGHPVYTLSRAADVHRVLIAPDDWSNVLGPGVGFANGATGDIQHFDPPEHTARRKFARPEFNPTRIHAIIDATQTLASRLADELEPRSGAELHDDFALPLPIIAFIDLLGVPHSDRGRIKQWADLAVLGLGDPYAGGRASSEVQDYVAEKVQQRRAAADAAGTPGDDAVGNAVPAGLLSTYALRLFRGERLPLDQISNMVFQLMVAGHETTTSLITNMVWRLLERRELWEQLIATPSLVEKAVEESLRFDPPVLGLCRTNNAPTTLLGVDLAKDTKVMVLYASANRDPDVFSDPDTFRLDRDPLEAARHYSFGWGTHHCMGAHLARQTARIALSVLIERFPDLRLAGLTQRIAPSMLWGRRRLPVAW